LIDRDRKLVRDGLIYIDGKLHRDEKIDKAI